MLDHRRRRASAGSGRHEPEIFARDRPRRHAQRLGPLPADRTLRDRPVVRLELGPVRPPRAHLVARHRSRSSAWRRRSCPRCSNPGSVVGPLTRRAADETGLAAGTPVVVGGADTQLGLVGIGVVGRDRLDARRRQLLAADGRDRQPLIDPQARVRTLCHAVPGRVDDRGDRLLLRHRMRWFRDAFCEPETAEAAPPRSRRRTWSWRRSRRACPPARTASSAIFSNVMNAKRWVQASPAFVQFDVDQPATLEPARRASGRWRSRPPTCRGPPRHHRRS